MSHAPQRFPLYPLLGAGGLVLVSLLSVAWLQWFAEPVIETGPTSTVLLERSLQFEDAASGAVLVIDADTGELVANLPAGQHGFVRATVRGLARSRRARGLGPEVPFTLEQHDNGQLLLIDPLTGQAIDLWAFGTLNAQPFSEFLKPHPFDTHSSASAAGPARAPALAHSDSRSN